MSKFLSNFIGLSQQELLKQPFDSEVWLYLKKRGVSFDIASKYSMGFFNYLTLNFLDDKTEDFKLFKKWYTGVGKDGIIIFPVKTAYGVLQGFVCRSLKRKFYSKFFLSKYSTGKTSKILGLYENLELAVKKGYSLLVEGPFDMLAISACGLPVFSVNTANVSESQAFVLSRYLKKLIIIFDNDSTGERSKLKNLDKNGIIFYKTNIPLAYKDLSEMYEDKGLDELKDYLKQKIIYNH